MKSENPSIVVVIEELLNPADDENERAALHASVAVEAFETIGSPAADAS